MAQHNITGEQGEKLAAEHLMQKGYQILETNWCFKNVEIDIIAQKDDTLIIAEVKTRTGSYFGEPEVFVKRDKQKHLVKAANAYIEKNNLDLEVRFDIVAIVITKEQTRINHIPSAFYPLI